MFVYFSFNQALLIQVPFGFEKNSSKNKIAWCSLFSYSAKKEQNSEVCNKVRSNSFKKSITLTAVRWCFVHINRLQAVIRSAHKSLILKKSSI